MFRNTAVAPALLVLLVSSIGCKEDEPPANEPGDFGEPCIEGALADTPDGCADGLECYKGYCEETCVEDTDCRPIEGWMHTCVVGQCQILCNDDDACPQDLGTAMTCGVIGNSRWCEAKDDTP